MAETFVKTALVLFLLRMLGESTAKVLDLGYTFDSKTIYVKKFKPFKLTQMYKGDRPDGFWVNMKEYGQTHEHGGTHMDAPLHFIKNGLSVDKLDTTRMLMAPCVVVDISKKAAEKLDATLDASDLIEWEKQNGRIPDGAVVLMHSGWGKYWRDRNKFLGFAGEGENKTEHFPGWSEEGARWLTTKRPKVVGVGVDSASLDTPRNKAHMAHQVLLGAGLWGLEMVANTDKLPAKGTKLIVLPMKIGGGTGGPTRVMAVWDNQASSGWHFPSGLNIIPYLMSLLAIMISALVY